MRRKLPLDLAHLEDRFIEFTNWNTPAVYLLWDGNEVVYVGRASKSVAQRISEHETRFFFDYVEYIPCGLEQVRDLEIAFIKILKPKHNRAGLTPGYDNFMPFDVLQKHGFGNQPELWDIQ